jgi:hypothetical protein
MAIEVNRRYLVGINQQVQHLLAVLGKMRMRGWAGGDPID